MLNDLCAGPGEAVAGHLAGLNLNQQHPGLQALYCNIKAQKQGSDRPTASKPATANQQHRVWYILDHTAVLPEYLVTWRYGNRDPGLARQAGTSPPASSSQGVGKDPLWQLCAQPLDTWVATASQQQRQSPADTLQDKADQALMARCAAALAGCKPTPPPKLPYVARSTLGAFTGTNQVRESML